MSEATDPRLQLERARTLIELDRRHEAIEVLNGMLATDPENVAGWCNLGSAYLGTNQPQQADAAARRALSMDPESAWANRILSMALYLYGPPAEAVKAARRAIELEPHEALSHASLAMSLAETKTEDGLAEAEDAAQRAVALAPGLVTSYNTLGRVQLARRKRQEAGETLKRALEIDPENVEARNLLATSQMDQGLLPRNALRLASAAKVFGSVVSINPRSAHGRANIDLTLRLFFTRVSLATLGVVLLAEIAFWNLPSGSDVVAWVRTFTGLSVLLPIAYTVVFVLRLDPPIRRLLWGRLRQPRLVIASLCHVVGWATILIGVVWPTYAPVLLAVAAVAVLVAPTPKVAHRSSE